MTPLFEFIRVPLIQNFNRKVNRQRLNNSYIPPRHATIGFNKPLIYENRLLHYKISRDEVQKSKEFNYDTSGHAVMNSHVFYLA